MLASPKNAQPGNFYPRPLRGGRQYRLLSGTLTFKFLSTPSARRATRRCPMSIVNSIISIHALCEEGDTCSTC